MNAQSIKLGPVGRLKCSGGGLQKRMIRLTWLNGFSALSRLRSYQSLTRLRAIMSEDMGHWRPFLSSATNKLNNFKGYLASKDPRPLSSTLPSASASSQRSSGDPSGPGADSESATRQSWTQWAGEKLRLNGQAQGNDANVVERVLLFPGWAARRLHTPSPGEGT